MQTSARPARSGVMKLGTATATAASVARTMLVAAALWHYVCTVSSGAMLLSIARQYSAQNAATGATALRFALMKPSQAGAGQHKALAVLLRKVRVTAVAGLRKVTALQRQPQQLHGPLQVGVVAGRLMLAQQKTAGQTHIVGTLRPTTVAVGGGVVQ